MFFSDADKLLGLATPRGGEHGDVASVPAVHDDDAMDEGGLQVRTMEVPRWLSTTDVTGECC